MNGSYAAINPPSGMFVRALYDYDADDHTSLSFRQGDIIQVITQLESGWWDGVIGGVQRGWFPSNYCEVVSRPEDEYREGRNGHPDDTDGEESQDDFTDQEYDDDTDTNEDGSRYPIDDSDGQAQGEAAFWIPQATPDGRLFYFNTLTGVSAMELPLENPTAANESGPRDRTNVYIPPQTRVPPELMAGGFERDEDTDFENSASEAEMHSSMKTSGTLVGPSFFYPLPKLA
jgi:son of sevenless